MNDYQIVSLACFAALFLLVFVPIWVGKAIGRGREMPAPPVEPTIPPAERCMKCGQRGTHSTHGWRECDDCRNVRIGRAPFDQEAAS